jgi:alkanesulfonate monooxygenase SsuD/methylene tetrahydromethanopterin reductase-like flavin-dependent oxidoreductase (luciferase family)
VLPVEISGGTSRLRAVLAEVEDAGLDFVGMGDHVAFRGGFGVDGLVTAAAMLAAHPTLCVATGVYLLPLRHPVTVARQLSTIAALAPGRFTFGVGLGGEDPAELRACGVDPRTRGRRMDESLTVLRRLLAGDAVTCRGEFFDLDDVRVLPAPDPPVPIVVGGRSDAAVRRAGRLGDGWLGIWVSPQRATRP